MLPLLFMFICRLASEVSHDRSYDVIVTAMSANSTRLLLSDVAPHIAAEAGNINSNVCWALMVAFSKPTGKTVTATQRLDNVNQHRDMVQQHCEST